MKDKPKSIGKVSACSRHRVYVKECPRCNIECRGEEHTDKERNRTVFVPVQRVRITQKPYVKKGERNGN
jgi:hypothetical protein